ncbi:MAG TPA: 2-oxoglutarate dehydrogenase complex dihydrolipoyllysine-residue succinyltransferase [Vicinamibacterales bacterium]|nr:2-oxoglutarate dehydrogenase complex dihydrolipoyllysine-residue succinyltransferase [Vicinamibacterales bacterium]
MPVNIIVPEVGESIVDARVAKWLKKAGDAVAAGEPIVELETDKVDVEVAAPRAGVIATIAHGDGADVKIGDVLGTIGEGPGAVAGSPGTDGGGPKEKSNGSPGAAAGGPGVKGNGSPAVSSAGSPPATPSARKAAREKDVELAAVKMDGPRVTKADVERSVATPAVQAKAPAPTNPPSPLRGYGEASRREERVRMSKRRATIAKRLVEAQQTAAMLTTFNEVDMSAVMALRERRKESFKTKHGVSLGIASFFVKAAIAALREFPRLNAEIQGDEMVLKHYYDIGVAVGAAEGLVVPVLRDADRMSFAGIEAGIREFAKKAEGGTLTIDDLRGGTFSLTNGGVFGSLMSTPILNPPQVGILGLHAIKERPVGVGGQVVLRPMMYTALTYDHRIVDGSEAVRFLVRVKELVEDPGVLLVES